MTLQLTAHPAAPAANLPWRVDIDLCIDELVLFEPAIELQLIGVDGALCWQGDSASAGCWLAWLPRGQWRFAATFPAAGAAATLRARLHAGHGTLRTVVAEAELALPSAKGGQWQDAAWSVRAGEGSPPVDELAFRRGHADWFFRHFDHAAGVVGSYMLGDSALLRGRILDMGCGDGITDLGLYLRYQPELLVGVDPFKGFERLLDIARANHLPLDALPPRLRFLDADGNHLPFPDDSFDVVVSWGSVEHIVGGYAQALREIKRVLRPNGLLFIHPGLYYSNFGHHLGEFSSEPHFHLKLAPDKLRELVLNSTPNYMDRAGEFATPAQYWQWYTELNPITVAGFEAELRALDFEFHRAALRVADRIDYSPELQRYPLIDLAADELYLSCWNRKQARPEGFEALDPMELLGGAAT
jgi:SAM-dependent methyltransferase